MMRTGMAGLLLAALVIGTAGPSAAQAPSAPAAGAIEGVAAVVGDVPILRSEVEEQFVALAPQFQVDASDTSQANQLRREILDNLISEQLLTQEAEAVGFKADDARSTRRGAPGDRIRSRRIGAEGFAASSREEGINEDGSSQPLLVRGRGRILLRRTSSRRRSSRRCSVTDAQVLKHFTRQQG